MSNSLHNSLRVIVSNINVKLIQCSAHYISRLELDSKLLKDFLDLFDIIWYFLQLKFVRILKFRRNHHGRQTGSGLVVHSSLEAGMGPDIFGEVGELLHCMAGDIGKS